MNQTSQINAVLAYAGVTQTKLAELLGTSKANISQKIKRGTFTTNDLERIAEVLNIKFVSYFEFEDGKQI